MMIKHNTGYEHIHIWREEWAVESQKVLHIFKDGQALVKDEYHASLGLEIVQVQVIQGTTTIATIDFRECATADILLNYNQFGNIALKFNYIYYYDALQTPYVIDSYTETTLTINQKTIVNTDVIPRCTGEVVQIDEDTTLFAPPTINIIDANTSQTIVFGCKSTQSNDFLLRINANGEYINATMKNETWGQNNTKTQWFFTEARKTTLEKILNGAIVEIVRDNIVVWNGRNIASLNMLNNATSVQVIAHYVNYSRNNSKPFTFNAIVSDEFNITSIDFINKRYQVGESFFGKKNYYNELDILHNIEIPNLSKYDIWFYTNLLACSPRYLITDHVANLQNNKCIYIVKKWNIKQPEEGKKNGVITIELKRYGNNN